MSTNETLPSPSNYSYPNRRRASTVTPERRRRSLWPLSFGESSDVPLLSPLIVRRYPSRSDMLRAFDFDDNSPGRPATSYSTISTSSRPDSTMTALPFFEQPPVPPIPQQYSNLAPIQAQQQQSSRIVQTSSSSQMPATSSKADKGALWRKLKVAVKKAFSFGRRKRITIGEPYNFRHEITWAGSPPTTIGTAAHNTVTGRGGGETAAAGDETLMSGALGGVPTVGHVIGTGARTEAVPAAATADESGDLSSDDAAISDDGDSSWEDAEPSMVFPVIHDRDATKRNPHV